MNDFLRNIFSRGNVARTDSPIVSVGGVSSNSATLTYDVLHFDSTGNLLVNAAVGGAGGGTVSISGTQQVNVVQWGSSNVQSASFGVPTVGWFQRLDATNDAVTVYQAVTNSWTVSIRDSSGNSIIATNTTPALSGQGVNVRPIFPTTILSAYTFLSGTTGNVVVAATDGNRRFAVANNDSTAVMYLNYGVSAGTQTYFVRIPSLGYWEMPLPIWQGSLSAIWDSANVGAGRFTILS
jgi:hypothetical protein